MASGEWGNKRGGKQSPSLHPSPTNKEAEERHEIPTGSKSELTAFIGPLAACSWPKMITSPMFGSPIKKLHPNSSSDKI